MSANTWGGPSSPPAVWAFRHRVWNASNTAPTTAGLQVAPATPVSRSSRHASPRDTKSDSESTATTSKIPRTSRTWKFVRSNWPCFPRAASTPVSWGRSSSASTPAAGSWPMRWYWVIIVSAVRDSLTEVAEVKRQIWVRNWSSTSSASWPAPMLSCIITDRPADQASGAFGLLSRFCTVGSTVLRIWSALPGLIRRASEASRAQVVSNGRFPRGNFRATVTT
mmetsp:Transcript_86682/g.197838  ORF Transcript_86682/g.197838 Transcript_86682/m.197838 type:complete len:223 (+) Transcript_86682:468-1136(+)